MIVEIYLIPCDLCIFTLVSVNLRKPFPLPVFHRQLCCEVLMCFLARAACHMCCMAVWHHCPGFLVKQCWRLCSAIVRSSDLLICVDGSLECVYGWDRPIGGDPNLTELLIKLPGQKRPLAQMCTCLEPLVGISAKGPLLYNRNVKC